MSCQILPFPEELRPRLPIIVGNVDYRTLRERLEQIDSLLRLSGLERDFVQRSVERWRKASKRKEPTTDEQTNYQERSRRALRGPKCMAAVGGPPPGDTERYAPRERPGGAGGLAPSCWKRVREAHQYSA